MPPIRTRRASRPPDSTASAAGGWLLMLIALFGFGLCAHIVRKPDSQAALRLRSEGIEAAATLEGDSFQRRRKGITSFDIGYTFEADGARHSGRQTISGRPDLDHLVIRYLPGTPAVNAIDVDEYVGWHLFNLYWIGPLSAVLLLVGLVKAIVARRAQAAVRAAQLQLAGTLADA